jgi:hypothetical protein
MGKGKDNHQLNFVKVSVIPIDQPSSVQSFNEGTMIHNTTDDISPWMIHGTFIGGNQGNSFLKKIIVSNHGMNSEDIGTALVKKTGDKF